MGNSKRGRFFGCLRRRDPSAFNGGGQRDQLRVCSSVLLAAARFVLALSEVASSQRRVTLPKVPLCSVRETDPQISSSGVKGQPVGEVLICRECGQVDS